MVDRSGGQELWTQIANKFGRCLWWTLILDSFSGQKLVDMSGGHKLHLLFRSDQQSPRAGKQGRACTHRV
jgi:hypothetical protein